MIRYDQFTYICKSKFRFEITLIVKQHSRCATVNPWYGEFIYTCFCIYYIFPLRTLRLFYICVVYVCDTITETAETRAVHRECNHFREKALRKIHARTSEHRVHSPASFVVLRIGAMYHFRSNNS